MSSNVGLRATEKNKGWRERETNRPGGDKNLILAMLCERSSGYESLAYERHWSEAWQREMMEGKHREGLWEDDRADSPSIKLIIENMGKSYHCGCNWGVEKITWLLQFECQRRNHSGLGQKNIWREREGLLTIAYKLNIHQCHTTIIHVAAQRHLH